MRIESVELSNLGQFRETKIIGPLDAGLNILAEPNEAGKSTVVKAITRAFFDRYNAQHEDIRSLRPAGTSLCPQVKISFAANGERYRLEKCFLDKKSSDLFRWSGEAWERVAESHQADQRVRELLGAPQPDGVMKIKPEHWGLLQFLWARQGEPALWPEWNGADGERARSMLAAVELDPVVRALCAALREQYETLFTPTAKVRANSLLERAAAQFGELETQLKTVRGKRAEIESLEQRHDISKRELEMLTHQLADAKNAAEILKTSAEQAERQLANLATLEAEFKTASSALERIKTDQETVKIAALAIQHAEENAKLAQARLDRVDGEIPAMEREIQQTQNSLEATTRHREQAQTRINRIAAQIRFRQLAENLRELEATKTQVAALASEFDQLCAQKTRLPALTEKKVKKWRALDSDIRELRARIEASGLSVTLCAERGGMVEVESDRISQSAKLSAEKPQVFKASQSLVLALPEWGTVRIISGAAEIGEMERRLSEQQKNLAVALEEFGLTRLGDAEAALAQITQISQQAERAQTGLRAHLGKFENIAALDAETAHCARKLASQRETFSLPNEEDFSLTALESEEQHAGVFLQQTSVDEKRLREISTEQIAKRETVSNLRETAQRELAKLRAEIQVHSDQKAKISERYQNDLSGEFSKAQREFVKAEARCDEAKRELPADAQNLPERSKQAARAAAQVEAEFQQKADVLRRLEAQLETRGGEGLYSQESRLEEQIEEARAETLRLRKRGWAQRLVFELIERREQSATERVLRPLEDRLSAVFAELSGVRNRRVFFNEKLEITGIGSRADEAHAFAELSQGGKEQLLLALRAAIALEVAKTDPPLLILDDVLVHTDPMRQQNVLEYLQSLAAQMQILVLTCHADRYRGVGRIVRLSAAG
jgi:hypothetical protein